MEQKKYEDSRSILGAYRITERAKQICQKYSIEAQVRHDKKTLRDRPLFVLMQLTITRNKNVIQQSFIPRRNSAQPQL